MAETNSSRLDRIEEKLDRLTDAMVAMARAEEKIIGLQEDQNNMFERINRHSEKLDAIQKTVDDNHRTICIINRVFWVVTVAVIGSIITQAGVL
jgi:predicted  nucleic acid-binding Zn-ribbon protein